MTNRIFSMGIAAFIALVALSLTGGEKQAVAGHGCHGGGWGCAGGGGWGCHGGGHGCVGRGGHGCVGRGGWACAGRGHHRRAGRGWRCAGGGGGACHGCPGAGPGMMHPGMEGDPGVPAPPAYDDVPDDPRAAEAAPQSSPQRVVVYRPLRFRR